MTMPRTLLKMAGPVRAEVSMSAWETSDRLLVTVLRHRWKTQIRALTSLLGSPANAVGDAVHEMTPILEALDRRIRQAPITAPTTADLANLIGRTHTKKGK